MIRLAQTGDLDRIMDIYSAARAFMRRSGNPTQWGDHHPPRDMLEQDIAQQHLYVWLEDGVIHGVFAFVLGDDPSYAHIEDGNWLNDEPYGTIHRIASSGETRGVFAQCLAFCRGLHGNIRIDTHHDNLVMQQLVTRHGFVRCGIVYVSDGSPRIAYQYTATQS